jgi:hypothetical protein
MGRAKGPAKAAEIAPGANFPMVTAAPFKKATVS